MDNYFANEFGEIPEPTDPTIIEFEPWVGGVIKCGNRVIGRISALTYSQHFEPKNVIEVESVSWDYDHRIER